MKSLCRLKAPEDLLVNNVHLRLYEPNMVAVVIKNENKSTHNDLLQAMHCLEIVIAGEVDVLHAGSMENIKTGEVHLRKKGNYQRTYSEGFQSLAIFFENSFLLHFLDIHIKGYSGNNNSVGNFSALKFQVNEFILANTREVLTHIERPHEFSRPIVKSSAYQILLQLLANDTTLIFVKFLRRLSTERKVDLGYFMEENFTKNLSVAEMSKMTGRSISVFKKDFIDEFHSSPVRWQINRRLEHANYLILNTDEQISVIAYNCGFENMSHFSKVYKMKFAYSPMKTRSAPLENAGFFSRGTVKRREFMTIMMNLAMFIPSGFKNLSWPAARRVNSFLLNPYFLEVFKPALVQIAGPAWEINKVAASGETQFEQMKCIYTPVSRFAEQTITAGTRPVIIAGDCCISIAITAAFQKIGLDPILVYFDAHGDFNTRDTSPSGFIGGMPLAMLTGLGDQTLMQLCNVKPLVPSNVILTDGRNLDLGEDDAVKKSGIYHYKSIEQLKAYQFGSRPVYVHVDADVINPVDVPGVLYPAKGGARAEELISVFRYLKNTTDIRAISMGAWEPSLDPSLESKRVCLDLLRELYS